ncbi:MAG: DNA adenine methylase [Tissierellia bacterium]|nr:DNA adenine methylase [Tissierellia bacterium]
MKDLNPYPFVKWAGGKRQLLPEINKNLPEELLNNQIEKYIEPFVGGGAVLFDLVSKYKFKEIIINDYNEDLINLYKDIQKNVDSLIEKLSEISEEYLRRDDENRKAYYYKIRSLYNEPTDDQILKSAYFIFLNRTCFNGLYRVNSKGQFNVPYGRYKNPTILDENNLRNVSNVLKNVTILKGDFFNVKDYVDDKTFVYFDPPYRPLNKTSNFTSYSNNDFNDDEQKRLGRFFHELNDRRAKLLLSNSDPKNVNIKDNFFEDLYPKSEGFNIIRVNAKRIINSNSNGRGNITELLIKNY